MPVLSPWADSYSGIVGVIGTAYRDILTRDAANNRLFGGGHIYVIASAAGDDEIKGGPGKDRLTGGAGADDVVFRTKTDSGDCINDFDATVDQIVLDGAAFGFGPLQVPWPPPMS